MSKELRSLWSELKNRKVVRVAALYAAVGWGILLGGAELTQILELPAWFAKMILALVVLGFPVALVLAWAFEMTPDGVQRAAPLPSSASDRPSRKPFFAGIFVGVASLSLVAFLVNEDSEPVDSGPLALDADLVAIVPFLYSGPAELDYLGDGVFQLLASRFTGEVGPRATDPTATASVWDEASASSPMTANRDVALRLGAGLVLTGGVVAGPDGLNLSASLLDISTNEEVAAATAQGPPDSLAAVVERLAGGILSLSVGEYEESLAQLTSADPDALREYLLGQVEFREGRWFTALDHFVRAVEIDSTFALASIWIADAGNNVAGSPGGGLGRAWRHRDRLSERDRVYLQARLGPNYPDPATREERIRAYEAAARLAPDRANIWYFLGEETVHLPTSVEAYEQALRYFERALELDSRNGNVLLHLQLTNVLRRDVAGMIDATERLAALDTTRLTQLMPRFFRAVISEDRVGALSLYDSIQSEDSYYGPPFLQDSPAMLVGPWQIEPIMRGLEQFHAGLIPGSSGAGPYYLLYYAYQDLGLPSRADEVMTEYERANGTVNHRMRLLDAIYGALPDASGVAAATGIAERLRGLSDADWTPSQRRDLTALELWRIAHADLSGVDDAVRLFRRLQGAAAEARGKTLEAQALLLESMRQVRQGDPAARGTIEAMDALFLQGLPDLGTEVYDAMVLAIADTYERLGDHDQALLVLERESNFRNFNQPFGARFARERGRLAARTGDTDRAIREYRFYVYMRTNPEPALEAEVADVRAALAVLEGR
jgi:tetratricopeptide (TPR) repeat protein